MRVKRKTLLTKDSTERCTRINHEGDGEVTFREGDEVEVIQRSENGWWLVRTSEELGWGPSNYLQSLEH